MSFSSMHCDSPHEIQERVKRHFLDRLAQRVRRMRVCLMEKNWEEIRSECRQLQVSSDNFGFTNLTQMSAMAERAMPQKNVFQARALPEARQAVAGLVAVIDQILMENPARP